MENLSKAKRLSDFIKNFKPEFEPKARGLAVYSAAIAIGEESALKDATMKASELGAETDSIYEVILQSYLFLGFPRMLTAVESFRTIFPKYEVKSVTIEKSDFDEWKLRGTELCRRVYGENFEKLKAKVLSFTQEIFDWMILEGYGKVLSRPTLHVKTRELAIVSCLMIDNRPKQLHSHMRGAINVGVDQKLLTAVVDDLKSIDENCHKTAIELLNTIKANV